jgi:hypothetical protein
MPTKTHCGVDENRTRMRERGSQQREDPFAQNRCVVSR